MSEESFFDFHEIFFSLTDEHGIILEGNDVFERVSEYQKEHLIGKPHNIIRHPDIPKAVFRLLWQYLHANKPIIAYVNNRSRTGKNYWVLATVFPVNDIYVSVRIKPSSPLFEIVRNAYKDILKLEHDGASIDECLEALVGKVQALGFTSYDQLMHLILYEELRARDKHLANNTTKTNSIEHNIHTCFSHSEILHQNMEDLQKATESLLDYCHTVSIMTLNLTILSIKLQQAGSTLVVVANNLKSLSQEIAEGSVNFGDRFKAIDDLMRVVLFKISISRLQTEMLPMLNTMTENNLMSNEELKQNIRGIIDFITNNFNDIIHIIEDVTQKNNDILRTIDDFMNIILGMGIVHINGRIESASIADDSDIRFQLEEMGALSIKMKDMLKNIHKICTYTNTTTKDITKRFTDAQGLVLAQTNK